MLKKIDKEKLNKYVEDGLIKCAYSSDGKLFIANYTDHCTYERAWDEYTLNLRGAVYDMNYEIVAANVSKFFNYEQLPIEKQKEIAKEKDFQLTVKYDGCLLSMFVWDKDKSGDGKLYFCSKGSFDSFVVDAAKKIIGNDITAEMLCDVSACLICEVISPETKILVDYHGISEIRVITSFDTNKFEENSFEKTSAIVEKFNLPYLKMVEVQNMTFEELTKWQRNHDWTEEGYVARFKDNYRVKFKSDDYLRVAAIRCETDSVHLYNIAVEVTPEFGDLWYESLYKHIEQLPDELQNDGRLIVADMRASYNEWYEKIKNLYNETKDLSDKELGLKNDDKELKKYKGLVYSLRKNKSIAKDILKICREKNLEKERIYN